jgi:hypothetical protein
MVELILDHLIMAIPIPTIIVKVRMVMKPSLVDRVFMDIVITHHHQMPIFILRDDYQHQHKEVVETVETEKENDHKNL